MPSPGFAESSCLDGMIVTDPELASSPPCKARRRDHDDTLVSDGMDWNNLVSWQHNPSYNAPNAFPMTQSNYQPNPSSSQLYQHPPVNYMMPFPPEPTPAKTVKPMMPPPGHAPVHPSQTTTSPGYPATLPVQPQKAWLTPPEEWQPGDGMLDINQLYSFSLPMTVANTRDMSGMDIRDVRLVQVIDGGISNWLLRPFAHRRFVTWEGFRTRTEALLWSTCLKFRRSQPLNLLTLEKDLANSLGLNIDDFNQRIKVHDHLGNLVLQFLQQHHKTLTPPAQEDEMLKKYNNLQRASTRRHSERRLLLRCPLRKMMQSWSHRLRSITHRLRRLPARYPR